MVIFKFIQETEKGKTTASLGLALRALGHGWKVLVIQFTKGDGATTYGEITSSSKFYQILMLYNLGWIEFAILTMYV